MPGDLLVHDRLREGGIVQLVVAVTAVADEIDEDVALELLPEADRETGGLHGGLGIVSVHVEDRGLDDLRDVARIAGEAVGVGGGGEGDLVVDDDVDRAPGPVSLELGEP